MRIHPSSRALKRVSAAVFAAVAALAGLAVFGVVGASPADAAYPCRTAGHTYLTRNGGGFFTFGNNILFGTTPSFSMTQGNGGFNFGGNGIQPGTRVTFYAVNKDTGAWTGLVNGTNYVTRGAGSNCVVNEEGPLGPSLPPGNFRVMAQWIAGQTGNFFNDAVVDLSIQAPPPPPPYDPWWDPYPADPCTYSGSCYGY